MGIRPDAIDALVGAQPAASSLPLGPAPVRSDPAHCPGHRQHRLNNLGRPGRDGDVSKRRALIAVSIARPGFRRAAPPLPQPRHWQAHTGRTFQFNLCNVRPSACSWGLFARIHKLRAWQPVRVLLAPPRTLLPAGLLHALPNCASVQRFSAAVSEVLRLWLRGGARFPRLSTARLRLLETVSRRRKQRPVRERRRPVRKHSARVRADRMPRPDGAVRLSALAVLELITNSIWLVAGGRTFNQDQC